MDRNFTRFMVPQGGTKSLESRCAPTPPEVVQIIQPLPFCDIDHGLLRDADPLAFAPGLGMAMSRARLELV